MPIMSYDEWKRRTKLGALQPRSGQLKFLDAALKEYDKNRGSPAHLETLKAAFLAWAETKGDAESSGRNRDGAVTDLLQQLINFQNQHRPAQHLVAPGLMRSIREGAQQLKAGTLKPQVKVKITLADQDSQHTNFSYEEFDNMELVKAKKAVADSVRCAQMAVNGVAQVGRTDAETERFRRWFGNPAPQRVAQVASDLNKMLMAHKSSKVTIVHRPDIQMHYVNGADPFGAMEEGFTGADVYGFVFNHQAGSGYRVVMGQAFLGDPDPIEGACQTVYHELTHKVLGTKDHCYGKVKSRGLATMQPEKALTNADNFAFYAVSFIKDI